MEVKDQVMQYHALGDSGIQVPEICLGTMTFGEQNSQPEAFDQLNYALENGLYFWDTAEMYSVPPKPETYGATETIIGNWFAQHAQREKVFLASKIAGPGFGGSHIREGHTQFGKHIEQALDGSLKRLQTDYIDLYQLHWPERHTNFFGGLGYANAEAAAHYEIEAMQDTLLALQKELSVGAFVILAYPMKRLGEP